MQTGKRFAGNYCVIHREAGVLLVGLRFVQVIEELIGWDDADADAGLFGYVVVRCFEHGFLFRMVFLMNVNLVVALISFRVINLQEVLGGGVIDFFELFVDLEMLFVFVHRFFNGFMGLRR